MTIAERIERYAERYFQQHGRTEFPTVRRVARALRIRQDEVEQEADGNENLMLTRYNVRPTPPVAEWFVEVLNEPR